MNSPCDSEEVCVTCSDQATPAEILCLDGNDMASTPLGPISVALVDVEVGDTVLVHAGEAIGVLRGGRE